MTPTKLHQQLIDIFSVMKIPLEKCEKYVDDLVEITLDRLFSKSDELFTPEEQKVTLASMEKFKHREDFFQEFFRSEKIQNIFLDELEKTIQEMLDIISNNSTPSEKELFLQKLHQIAPPASKAP